MVKPHATTTAPATPSSTRPRARVDVRARLLTGLPVTERRLSLNHLSTAVLEGGDGPPVVLLHGPAAYGAQWQHLIPDLVTTHRVIAPDLPGHGASDPINHPPDRAFIARWLDDLIESTCPIAPVLVGHTLGGAIAARFASERSERLASLVLVDTLGLSPFQPSHAFGAALHEFLSNPTEGTLNGLWGQCLFDLPRVRGRMPQEWRAINAYVLDRIQAAGRLSSLRHLMSEFGIPAISDDDLARIAVPTTLIWGRHDRATPLAVAEAASAQFGWSLHVIEDAADDPTLDRPDAFLSTLRQVLGTH
jgi:pimeloyl-ACP methyl ester carboxylesterase